MNAKAQSLPPGWCLDARGPDDDGLVWVTVTSPWGKSAAFSGRGPIVVETVRELEQQLTQSHNTATH